MSDAPARRAVVLAGATASGKTDLAIAAARACSSAVEILVLDSRQLYRDLNVATGKPDAAQRASVPHHLLDLLAAEEKPHAMWYRERAQEVLAEVYERGAVPLFVGGSGFYLRALREGFFELDADRERLEQVRARVAALDDEALRAALVELDAATVQRLHPNDRYRLGRALEIAWLTGESATQLQARFQPRPVLDTSFDILVLDADRAVLHAGIDRRTQAWLTGGWAAEVEAILARGIAPEAPALRTLGYREVVRWVKGQTSRERTAEQIVIATRRYARQQSTWFRKEPGARLLAPGDRDGLVAALESAGGGA